jgi:hypothetical protein
MFRLIWVIFRLILEPVNFYQAHLLGPKMIITYSSFGFEGCW